MNPERWRRVRQLFERVVELPADERSAFLEQACGSDDALRSEIEALISGEAEAPADFVVPPPVRLQGEPASALASGVSLGGFTLLEEIGRGASGVVYRARQEALKRDVAIKVFAANLLTTDVEIARFKAEVLTAGRMDHPSIAKVLDHGQSGDLLWYAMELVPGHGLDRELRRQSEARLGANSAAILPLPGDPEHASTVAELVAEVADALAHAHGAGAIHRDVKPSNLMLTPEGRLKLVDFGIAKSNLLGEISGAGDLTASHQLIGSVPYMSPEQARILKLKVDERTDVYSLGVVLYELLTLRRPFEGETTAEVLTKLKHNEPRPVRRLNPKAPSDLSLICARAMAKDPRERYPSALELRDDLRRFLNHEAIHASPPTLLRRLRNVLRRRRSWWVGGLLTLLALVAGWGLRRVLVPEAPFARLEVNGGGEGRLYWRAFDPRTGQPGEPEDLGRARRASFKLPPGYGRLVLVASGASVSFARRLRLEADTRLELPERIAPPDRSGMLLIPGGRLSVDGPWVSPLYGLEVDVEPFWIDETEVSIGEFRAFLAAHPDREAPLALQAFGEDRSYDRRPVAGVSFQDALDYAEWVGKRLPTHAEWQWAARGPEARRFPWGSEESWQGAVDGPMGRTGLDVYGAERFVAHTLDVDSPLADRTPNGLLHTLGNLSEWTETAFCDVTVEPPATDLERRIICGGFWDARERGSDLSQLQHWGTSNAYGHWTRGFRCAADVD